MSRDPTRGRRETDLKDWRSGDGKVLGVDIPPPRDGHLSVAVPPGVGQGVPQPTDGLSTSSDRIITLPNAISFARILLIPVVVACILVWKSPSLALGLLAVLVVSDWVDGKIARLWDMRSKLGEKLDPIADRILVTVIPVVFVIAGYVPLWVIIVLLGRDAILTATLLIYRRRNLVPEVIYLGKAATFALFWSFPLVLAGHTSFPGSNGLIILGEACLYWGLGLYLWSGAIYLWQAFRVARRLPPSALSR